MYVSRAVQSLCEDPIEDETVALVLEPDDETAPDTVATAAEAAGAAVERRLQFGDLEVTIPQTQIDDLCAIDGLATVQTADTIGIHPDEAGENFDPED